MSHYSKALAHLKANQLRLDEERSRRVEEEEIEKGDIPTRESDTQTLTHHCEACLRTLEGLINPTPPPPPNPHTDTEDSESKGMDADVGESEVREFLGVSDSQALKAVRESITIASTISFKTRSSRSSVMNAWAETEYLNTLNHRDSMHHSTTTLHADTPADTPTPPPPYLASTYTSTQHSRQRAQVLCCCS